MVSPKTEALHVDSMTDGTIRVVGELDCASCSTLRAAVKSRLADHPRCLVLDVSGLEFCDSSGLAVLVQAGNDLPDTSRLILHGAGPQLKRLLHIAGLGSTFTLT